MTNNQTWIFEKKIPVGEGLRERLEGEQKLADEAGVEINSEHHRSYVLVRVETSDSGSASNHKLMSDGFTEVKMPDSNQTRATILDDSGEIGENWFEFIDPSPDSVTYTERRRPLPAALAERINHDRKGLLRDLQDMLIGPIFVMPNFVSCELEADARRIEEAFK